ncbi:putative Thioredoxin-like superfamily [Helianthus annuus]|nr:putative Thioredoxin-like superfamily [Helianthus annuus]KAJ0459184.1 putative DCC1-like thiol-disulfide oxidoreductase family, Thioredoxin-like superfamily [Helianthus annuus]KAJ0639740.1 putative DCC1-like thiol-disulfide oxidoreductase family, Thioredoxin-like superfamily [Helianthus annuus]
MALRAVAGSMARRQLKTSANLCFNPFVISASNHRHRSIAYPLSNSPSGFRFSIRAIQETTITPITPMKEDSTEQPQSSPNWKVKMLYDGDCPLCMREVNMLKERNKDYNAINFVDISSDDYSPEDNQGLDYETAMGKIHAIMSDGTIVTNVEAFRKLYEAVGMGWIYAITKYEPVATIADAVYGVWAKYRLQVTGRPPLEEVLETRKKKAEICDDNKSCRM